MEIKSTNVEKSTVVTVQKTVEPFPTRTFSGNSFPENVQTRWVDCSNWNPESNIQVRLNF